MGSSGGDILVYDGGHYIDVSHGVYDSSMPAFSSSGKRIAYAAYRGEHGIEPVYGINDYTFSSKTTKKLTDDNRWSDWAPAWSPDDQYLAFVRSEPEEAMYMGTGEVWVMRADGTHARPLQAKGQEIRWAL